MALKMSVFGIKSAREDCIDYLNSADCSEAQLLEFGSLKNC